MSGADNWPQTPNEEARPPEAPPPIAPRPIEVRMPRRSPVVTYTILGVTLAVFLVQWGSEYLLGFDLAAGLGIKANELILQGQLWRLITPVLLHANLMHVGFNMYALYALGPELERHYGHWQFLTLYLVSGFAGVVASFALTSAPSLGASTAIFGLLGAHGVFAYQNQGVFGPRARQVLRNLVMIAAINFLIGLSPGIDNWGHLGGLIGGGLFAWLGGPKYAIAGMAPEYYLENQRSLGAQARASIGVTMIFLFVAAGVFWAHM